MSHSLRFSLPVQSALSQTTVRWPMLLLGGVVLFSPLIQWLPETVLYLPFLLSVVIFGLPHGAVDHLVPARLMSLPRRRSFALVGALYALAGGAYLLFWLLSPALAFVSFILLTWYHWGQGDVYTLYAVSGLDSLGNQVDRWLTILLRGGFPMFIPLLSHPGQYEQVAVAIVSLFDPAAVPMLAVVFDPSIRIGGVIAFTVLTLVVIALGYYRVHTGIDPHRGWLGNCAEIGLLWIYFWVLPPVFAIGVYFACWHSIRHIGRLAAIDDRSVAAIERGSIKTALRQFGSDAAPLTAASLIVFVGLFIGLSVGIDANSLLAVYLVGIALLTLPHVLIVTWMDHTQLPSWVATE
ncbi:beta-carotene 15,15'-dioxygenase, Brp/Blh family [Halorubraceae archaeon YAN]|nr:beta-carotene 15,15'-dioxygenase, Brp/Blh family [Halorubraceae archaeon YAN]